LESVGDTLKNINISVAIQNVEFVVTQDGTYGYEINRNYKSKIDHDIKDATLYITEKINFLHIFLFFPFIYDLFNGWNKANICIYVPNYAHLESVLLKNSYAKTFIKQMNTKSLDLKTNAGNIVLEKSNTDDLLVKITSGNLRIDYCTIGNGEICSTSGNISFIKSRSDNIKVSQSSGNLQIKDCMTKIGDISSTSGNIFIKTSNMDKITVKQKSGKLKIEVCKLEKGEIFSTSGNMVIKSTNTRGLNISTSSGNIFFKGVLSGTNDIKSSSGNINFQITESKQNYDLNIDTNSGTAYIDGQKQKQRKENQYNKVVKSENNISMKTKSGNIKINFN
jgi:DUF4097 and DUF4098 domain-containing protein YvlB